MTLYSQLTAGLGARLPGCSRGVHGSRTLQLDRAVSSFPGAGAAHTHGSGSASQLGLPAACLRPLRGALTGSRKTVSGVGGMNSPHSNLLCTFYLLIQFNSVSVCGATTLFGKLLSLL